MPQRGTCRIAYWPSIIGWVLACAGFPAAAAAVDVFPEVRLSARNAVPQCVTPARLTAFLRHRNGELPDRFASIAHHYERIGQALGVRWDFAFFQMQIETASLRFRRPDGTHGDVSPDQNNFAGLGAVGDGSPGESFPSVAAGVQAHLEHVLVYAGAAIPKPVAERTLKVQAWGVLKPWLAQFDRPVTFGDLAQRWSPSNPEYARAIARLAHRFYGYYCQAADLRVASLGPARTAAPVLTAAPRLLASHVFRPRDELPAGGGTPPPLPQAVERPQPAPQPTVAAPAARVPVAPARDFAAGSGTPASRPRVVTKDDEIRELVSGRTVHIRTSIGAVIPVRFTENGEMRGRAESLAFFLGAGADRGRWWVHKGRLCQRWRVWLDQRTHCISLDNRGGTIYWRSDDGQTGTARIASR